MRILTQDAVLRLSTLRRPSLLVGYMQNKFVTIALLCATVALVGWSTLMQHRQLHRRRRLGGEVELESRRG